MKDSLYKNRQGVGVIICCTYVNILALLESQHTTAEFHKINQKMFFFNLQESCENGLSNKDKDHAW